MTNSDHDLLYTIDQIWFDDDDKYPPDFECVVRHWPYLSPAARARLVGIVLAELGEPAAFDIDSAGDCEPQETPTEFEEFERERKRLAGQADTAW
jgi:hypothetical protein